jgi:uncharacterized protein (TIGR02466 family)
MSENKILSLFPEVVYTKVVDSISDEEITTILETTRKLNYVESGYFNKQFNSSASKDLYLFDKKEYKILSEKIMNEFNYFKDDVLRYFGNKFIYTTSWATKTEPYQTSEWHNHHNCFYSGVFYIKTDDDCGNLMFQDFNKKNLSVKPSDYNEYNSSSWQIQPKTKMLVLFPSHLYHKIGINNNKNITRYSLAFNFMPIGDIGMGDSKLVLDM